MDHLAELDRRYGPVAMLSLTQRALVPERGHGVRVDLAGTELADRIAGALVGAAVGSAIGLPLEWRRPRGAVRDPRPGARFAADVQLLARSAELQHEHGLDAPPLLAEWLADEPRLRNPGNAIPAVIDRLQVGMPWYEAGVGSFGGGALVRAVAAGLVYRDRPDWRPIVAGLDALVTHATVDAVAAAVTVADAVALLLASPVGRVDGDAVLDALETAAISPAVAHAVREARVFVQRGGVLRNRAQAVPALGAALGWALTHTEDPEAAIRIAVAAGGDTDTVGALVGAFTGAVCGVHALPLRWREAVREVDTLVALATRIAGAEVSEVAAPASSSSGGVHISFLLDRSGSMAPLTQDVIGGYNHFVESHRNGDGECRFTAVQFDSHGPFEVLVDDVDIHDVPVLDEDVYQPRGATPLYDAIGSLIEHARRRIDSRRRAGRPEHDQLVVIFTDGLENASLEWTQAEVFRRIETLKEQGWTFVFLGANQDSYAAGRRLGLADGSVSNFEASERGARLAFASVERASMSYRRKSRSARRLQRDDFFEGTKEAER